MTPRRRAAFMVAAALAVVVGVPVGVAASGVVNVGVASASAVEDRVLGWASARSIRRHAGNIVPREPEPAMRRRGGEHYAAMCVDKGCRMLSVGADVRIINAGIEAVKKLYGRFF